MKTVVLQEKQIHTGELILVNGEYPYQDDNGTYDIVPIGGEENILLDRKAAAMISLLLGELDGWQKICLVSGWRSMGDQTEIFKKSLQDNGQEFTNKYVALPGTSEHQTGLAIDLALKKDKINFLCPDFPYDGICQKFRQKAISYGFIERYPQNKRNITKIEHEPWHFRYVGIPHAEIMSKYSIALEEYIAFLREYRYGEKHYSYSQNFLISYVEAEKGKDTQLEIGEMNAYAISGNNIDGYIITEWR